MQGNLALTFLFKDQDLHEIIQFKKGTKNGKESPPDGSEKQVVRKASADPLTYANGSGLHVTADIDYKNKMEWNGMELSPTLRYRTSAGNGMSRPDTVKEEDIDQALKKFTDANGREL